MSWQFKTVFQNSLRKLSFRSARKFEPSLSDLDVHKQAYIDSITKPLFYKDVLLEGDIIYSKVLDDLADFDIRPDDIWIISYPHGGAQVVEEIVRLMVNHEQRKLPRRRPLEVQVVHVEFGHPRGHIRWYNIYIKINLNVTNEVKLSIVPNAIAVKAYKVKQSTLPDKTLR